MQKELRWHIGRDCGGLGTRRDRPPFRAYFFWVDNYLLNRAQDYSEGDLADEIRRRKVAGESFDAFEKAFARLKGVNGT